VVTLRQPRLALLGREADQIRHPLTMKHFIKEFGCLASIPDARRGRTF
jgi:hypothetical protein